jgi:hypothetical protein
MAANFVPWLVKRTPTPAFLEDKSPILAMVSP